MKKYFALSILLLANLSIYAQRIETDIFNDLTYESRDGRYRAQLKEDIFENLIFTDNNRNKITFKKEYLSSQFGNTLKNPREKADFFRSMVHRYGQEQGYEATFSVDIFDKTIIEDNRNNRIEYGTDIFGNPTYKERINGIESSINKDLMGTLTYRSHGQEATLREDIFHKWIYEDSKGNKLEFSTETWYMLRRKYGNDEDVFVFLRNEFLMGGRERGW